MSQLASLARVVPENLLAPSELSEFSAYLRKLITALASKSNVTKNTKEKLENASELLISLKSLINRDDAVNVVTSVQDTLKKAIDLLPAETKKEVKNSNAYKKLNTLLEQWESVSKPIGQQTGWSPDKIAFTKNHESSHQDAQISLNVGAEAMFSLALVSKADAQKKLGLKISENHCLVNQDVKAGYSLNGEVSSAISYLTIGAGLAKEGSVEFDTYYQEKSDTPTYKALWSMYQSPLIPWDLGSLETLLVSHSVNNSFPGYIACSTKMQSSLSLFGKLGIGRSLATKTDISGNIVDINATGSFSVKHQHTLKGEMSVFATRNENNNIELVISQLESKENSTTYDFSLSTKISGMDKVAGEYVQLILGKGNKLVNFLEENSSPGADFIENVIGKVDDKWYRPLVDLLLGQDSLDSAVKRQINDELKQVLNLEDITSQAKAEDIAFRVTNKLVSTFGVSETSVFNDTFRQLREDIETQIADGIQSLQDKLSDRSQKFFELVENETKEVLQPVAALGESVAEAVENVDGNIEKRFNIVINEYKKFKQKIEKALEKSANIKAGLALESQRSVSEKFSHKLRIIINDATSESVKRFYTSLMLGDDQKSSRLMAALESENKITVVPVSTQLKSALEMKNTLGVSLLDIEVSKVRNVNTELDISVDASGHLFVKSTYNARVTASGLSEFREASLNLTYGIAQATLNPEFEGTFGFEYKNEDSDLHTVDELTDFFNSLDIRSHKHFSDLPHTTAPVELVSKSNIEKALDTYSAIINEQSPTKYTHSKLSMSMRSGKDVYKALLGINKENLFNSAMSYLLYLSNNRNSVRQYLLEVVSLYQKVDGGYKDYNQLFDNLFGDAGSRSIRNGKIESDLRQLDEWDHTLSRWPNSIRGREDIWFTLDNYLTDFGNTARALRQLPATLRDVQEAVLTFESPSSTKDAVTALNDKLKRLSKQVVSDLDNWLDVQGILQNTFDDLLSSLGWGAAGINIRLLMFMLLLAEAMNLKKSPFIITITLTNKQDDRRVIYVQ